MANGTITVSIEAAAAADTKTEKILLCFSILSVVYHLGITYEKNSNASNKQTNFSNKQSSSSNEASVMQL